MRHRSSGTSIGLLEGGTLDTGAQLLSVLDQIIRARVQEAVREVCEDTGDPLIRSDRLGPNNRTVRGMIERGELAGVKIGNRWHVRRSEWERFTRELETRQRAERPTGLDPANETCSTQDDLEDSVDAVLAGLGLERKPARGRRGLGRTPQAQGSPR